MLFSSRYQANSAFHPAGVDSCRVVTWITGSLNDRPWLRMEVCLQVKVRGRELSLRPIGCTPVLFVTQNRRLWRYISGICLGLCLSRARVRVTIMIMISIIFSVWLVNG